MTSEFLEFYKNVDPARILCFDVETTGIDLYHDEILQLSIMDGNHNILLNAYFKPENHAEWPVAMAINEISPEMVADKPSLRSVLPKINEIFASAQLLVGYNSEWFDVPMLRKAGVLIPEELPSFDVMIEFAPIFGQWDDKRGDFKWQKLTKAAEYYNFSFKAHDSMEDVRATLYCFQQMVEHALEQAQKLPLSEKMQNAAVQREEARQELQGLQKQIGSVER